MTMQEIRDLKESMAEINRKDEQAKEMRFQLVMAVLTGFCANPNVPIYSKPETLAVWATKLVDAMIAELLK